MLRSHQPPHVFCVRAPLLHARPSAQQAHWGSNRRVKHLVNHDKATSHWSNMLARWPCCPGEGMAHTHVSNYGTHTKVVIPYSCGHKPRESPAWRFTHPTPPPHNQQAKPLQIPALLRSCIRWALTGCAAAPTTPGCSRKTPHGTPATHPGDSLVTW